jgi:hypothetical protein
VVDGNHAAQKEAHSFGSVRDRHGCTTDPSEAPLGAIPSTPTTSRSADELHYLGSVGGDLCLFRVWLEEEDDGLFLIITFLEIFLLLLELTSVFSIF